ncbi:hypothetical protein PMKS-001885 [Pichia membranifaciens]|uniref:Uncharacterized protein n=1 Tax=Pichia membranifaciens TaxID=4926 RepID=A0A1Q2YFV2_9ASCO|nr:hypothetical protein PMKS-001885 [Pichia membranifaciens]
MAITTKAERFYVDQLGGQSMWQMPRLIGEDDSLRIAYEKLSGIKDLVICLLGMIRGVRVNQIVSEKVRQMLGVPAKVVEPRQRSEEMKQAEKEEVAEENERDSDENVNDDDDDENEFALGLSDLEGLVSEGDDDFKELEVSASDPSALVSETDDLQTLKYFQRYNNLVNIIETERARENKGGVPVSAAVGFVQTLEELQVDAFSSYDLEINDIIENPNYVVRGCHNLSSRARRFLWDEYCRVHGSTESEEGAILSDDIEIVKADTPESQFAVSLKSYEVAKVPKFYTDYNRQRMRKAKGCVDDTYPELCKQVPLTVRQTLYNKWVEFTKLSKDDRESKVLKGLEKVQKPGMPLREAIEVVKQRKILDSFDCFFMGNLSLRKLKPKM